MTKQQLDLEALDNGDWAKLQFSFPGRVICDAHIPYDRVIVTNCYKLLGELHSTWITRARDPNFTSFFCILGVR